MNKPAPFTENQKAFFDRCFTSWFNVAEGGKRGGKNVLTTLAYCVQLETHPNRLHLVAGVSIATAKLNILDCDGYGMLNYFSGRCREGKYKNRDCLFVQTATGEKVVLVSGGARAGDEKLIKGNTYGMAYLTEANECHPDFNKEVFDRTLSSKDRKIFHDLNPKAPSHPYYADILNFHEQAQSKDKTYGYNYGHFTIADNMSISNAELKRALSTYDKSTVWYRRDILGKRCAAEGIIYRLFADKTEQFIIDTAPDIAFCTVGVDFGGNASGHAFNCTGFRPNLRGIVTLDDYFSKQEMAPSDLEEAFVAFIKRQIKAGRHITEVFADSAEQVLIRGLRNALSRAGIGIPIRNALKGPIIDRIRLYTMLMGAGRYKIMRHCEHTIEAFSQALWDSKQLDDTRLDDGSTNIDNLDAVEYSTERYQKQLIDMMLFQGGVTDGD